MLILALDASTGVTTVAVGEVDGERRSVLAEVSLPGAGASETLLRAVEAALSLCGKSFSGVDGIVVGVGPGTFTGIRIAAATARSLALGSGVKLYVNSTLSALASSASGVGASEGVIPVVDAKRGEVFASLPVPDAASGEDIFCGSPEELAAKCANGVSGDLLLVGDGAVRYRNVLRRVGVIPPDGSPLNRVAASGHLASVVFEAVEPEAIVPLYVREPDAEVRRDLNPWLGA